MGEDNTYDTMVQVSGALPARPRTYLLSPDTPEPDTPELFILTVISHITEQARSCMNHSERHSIIGRRRYAAQQAIIPPAAG